MHAQARTSRKRSCDKTFARAFTARTDVSVNGSLRPPPPPWPKWERGSLWVRLRLKRLLENDLKFYLNTPDLAMLILFTLLCEIRFQFDNKMENVDPPTPEC